MLKMTIWYIKKQKQYFLEKINNLNRDLSILH